MSAPPRRPPVGPSPLEREALEEDVIAQMLFQYERLKTTNPSAAQIIPPFMEALAFMLRRERTNA